MTARCPMPPALDEIDAAELDRVIGAPLRCTSCGGELELRCGEGHLHQAPASRSPNHRPAVKAEKVRTCEAGHPLPRWKSRCLICRPKTLPRREGGTAQYKPKTCVGCAETFQPTGPRSIRCTKCRGGAS